MTTGRRGRRRPTRARRLVDAGRARDSPAAVKGPTLREVRGSRGGGGGEEERVSVCVCVCQCANRGDRGVSLTPDYTINQVG